MARFISTRDVAAITEQLCGSSFSSMQVSRAAKMLDEELESWRSHPLGETPYLFLDAYYEKVRQAGHVRDAAILMASGIKSARRVLLER
jgi:putative transposase